VLTKDLELAGIAKTNVKDKETKLDTAFHAALK